MLTEWYDYGAKQVQTRSLKASMRTRYFRSKGTKVLSLDMCTKMPRVGDLSYTCSALGSYHSVSIKPRQAKLSATNDHREDLYLSVTSVDSHMIDDISSTNHGTHLQYWRPAISRLLRTPGQHSWLRLLLIGWE